MSSFPWASGKGLEDGWRIVAMDQDTADLSSSLR